MRDWLRRHTLGSGIVTFIVLAATVIPALNGVPDLVDKTIPWFRERVSFGDFGVTVGQLGSGIVALVAFAVLMGIYRNSRRTGPEMAPPSISPDDPDPTLAADTTYIAGKVIGHLREPDATLVDLYRVHWQPQVDALLARLYAVGSKDEALDGALKAKLSRASIETIGRRLNVIGDQLTRRARHREGR